MKYYSLNHNAKDVGFLEAVQKGLAPDRGLYFPKEIPTLNADFIENINQYSDHEIAYRVIQPFVGNDIPKEQLKKIVKLINSSEHTCIVRPFKIYYLVLVVVYYEDYKLFFLLALII